MWCFDVNVSVPHFFTISWLFWRDLRNERFWWQFNRPFGGIVSSHNLDDGEWNNACMGIWRETSWPQREINLKAIEDERGGWGGEESRSRKRRTLNSCKNGGKINTHYKINDSWCEEDASIDGSSSCASSQWSWGIVLKTCQGWSCLGDSIRWYGFVNIRDSDPSKRISISKRWSNLDWFVKNSWVFEAWYGVVHWSVHFVRVWLSKSYQGHRANESFRVNEKVK